VIIRPGSPVAGTVTKYVLLVFNIAAGAVLMPFTVAHLGRTDRRRRRDGPSARRHWRLCVIASR
jgi:hypothetical protein